jgi:hypothetical protein
MKALASVATLASGVSVSELDEDVVDDLVAGVLHDCGPRGAFIGSFVLDNGGEPRLHDDNGRAVFTTSQDDDCGHG